MGNLAQHAPPWLPQLTTRETCEYTDSSYTWYGAPTNLCRDGGGNTIAARTTELACENDATGYTWTGGDVSISASGGTCTDGNGASLYVNRAVCLAGGNSWADSTGALRGPRAPTAWLARWWWQEAGHGDASA